MGFCKICTGRRKPGRNIKIVVNLKKDTICPTCVKVYDIKEHKKRKDKKIIIHISRLSYHHAGSSRRGGPHRLLLPVYRSNASHREEAGWLDMEISGGDDMGVNWLTPRSNVDMDVGNTVYDSGCYWILEVA